MRSHRFIFVFAVTLSAFWGTQTASARPRPAGKSKSFEANKTFGLGLAFGAPSGLSGKYYLGTDTALDFGIGGYYGYRYDSAFNLHGDFLWHPLSLASADAFELPLYFGLGMRILQHGNYGRYVEHAHVGLRAPLGIAFDFNRVPLDIFLEVALVFDFLLDDRHNRLELPFSFGLRYYFN